MHSDAASRARRAAGAAHPTVVIVTIEYHSALSNFLDGRREGIVPRRKAEERQGAKSAHRVEFGSGLPFFSAVHADSCVPSALSQLSMVAKSSHLKAYM